MATQASPSAYPNNEAILAAVAAGKLSVDEAGKLLTAHRPAQRLYAKVSGKGAVSVYGLQRMPVTLYGQQWDRLFGFIDELKAFIEANKGKLSVK